MRQEPGQGESSSSSPVLTSESSNKLADDPPVEGQGRIVVSEEGGDLEQSKAQGDVAGENVRVEGQGEAEGKRPGHMRQSSWLSESHPRYIWKDTSVRKQMREEFRKESERMSADSSSGEEEEVDDADMKYGLDPGFVDIDEELRVVEVMINEHTVIEEVEEEDEEEEQGQGVAGVNKVGTRALRIDTVDGTVVGMEGLDIAGKRRASKSEGDIDMMRNEDINVSQPQAVVKQDEDKKGEPDTPQVVSEDVKAMNEKKEKPRRVRLVELPDYLAMVAKDHQRQLLEKQRRDLAIAAEAANARDATAAVPRSQNRIRRGYFDRLGIAGDSAPISPTSSVNASRRLDMGINARRAAIASARTRRRPPSMRVKLRQSVTSSKNKGFFNKLASWMSAEPVSNSTGNEPERASSGTHTSLDQAPKDQEKKHIGFTEVADVYFIPARTDYPQKVKHAIWHTRSEFVEMVMRNMDQLEAEMQEEVDAQRRLHDLKKNPPPSLPAARH
mmetsp:Transcript_6044/g.9444  ORF Transcript_6044/g.9444 Transcript_6044/m.9444 type:complete len:500 (-) Transcript_6044:2010-3509(-)|eukprot:CAMPEP_0203746666 /NCGR_PEP_ID=MMETSP0098-20131031/2042_1 /ASSEMBLY_ACC=CAM_ASM_000208 /TAXON_ID=96639 /ORGANISM=" , Strain NY0313808BC1" /LENGTH=499 /DNA_ID=CAMNT_0050634847 /DNA_START=481 /DNA_END=1980 /DNA_ORIENTATION=+